MTSSSKARERHPLDELLGVDTRAFDDDELTTVLPRGDEGEERSEEITLPPEVLLTSLDGIETIEAEEIPISENRPTVPGEPLAPSPHVPAVAGFVEPSPGAASVSPHSGVGVIDGRGNGDDPLIGTLVDGRYRVLGVLGSGGIGLVYLCQHELLQKPVALKVLRPEYVSHRDLNERFLIEARAASSIKSPRIVDTIDVGTLPNGAPYFVMEYVEGETLASLLERDGIVELSQALEIARQIAEGLAAAHAAGVVHRDLKPENVFLARQPDGVLFAKLFDFGIAKVANQRKRLTYVGAVFGTPTYMSPEQARGEAVDERADLYALGIMIFEMLAGAVPFDGEDPLAIMAQHVDRPAPSLSSVCQVPIPASLEAIVQRCLEKDPAARYPSAAALLEDLNRVSLHEPPAVPTPPPPPVRAAETLHTHVMPVSAPPRRRGRALFLSLVALAVVGLGGWAAWKELGPELPFSAEKLLAKEAAPERAAQASAPAGDANASQSEAGTEVHFVLSPVDARVFRGEKDLGPMPVSVHVKPGETVTVTVRRKGYSTRKVVVDGSEQRVVVGLVKSSDGRHTATRTRQDNAKRSPNRGSATSRSSAR